MSIKLNSVPTWGDTIIVSNQAPLRPGSVGSVYAVEVVSCETRAKNLEVEVGDVILGIEFGDGSSIELPAAFVSKTDI